MRKLRPLTGVVVSFLRVTLWSCGGSNPDILTSEPVLLTIPLYEDNPSRVEIESNPPSLFSGLPGTAALTTWKAQITKSVGFLGQSCATLKWYKVRSWWPILVLWVKLTWVWFLELFLSGAASFQWSVPLLGPTESSPHKEGCWEAILHNTSPSTPSLWGLIREFNTWLQLSQRNFWPRSLDLRLQETVALFQCLNLYVRVCWCPLWSLYCGGKIRSTKGQRRGKT